MADEVKIPLKATWDGRAVERGVSGMKAQVAGLKTAVGQATSFMAGPAGFLGVSLSVASVANQLRGLAEEDRAMRRLATTFERFAGTAPDMERLNRQIVALQSSTTFDDTQIAATLQELIQLTGSTDKAIANLELTLDLAAATGKDTSSAVRLVGFAMEGMVEPLSRLSPAFRKLKEEGAGAAEIMAELRRFTAGAAADDVNSLAGSFERLANAANEFVDSGLETVFNNDLVGAVNALATGMFNFAEGVRSLSGHEKILNIIAQIYTGGGATMGLLGGAYNLGMIGRGARATSQPFSNMPVIDPSTFGAGGGGDDGGGGGGGGTPEWYRRSVGVGGIMGWGQDMADGVEEQAKQMRQLRDHSRVYLEDWERITDTQEVGAKLAAEHVKQVEQLASTLGGQLAGVFLDGQAGFKQMVDYWVRYLIQSGITNILMNLFTGGAAGGIFGGLFGGGGGGGGVSIGGGRVAMDFGARRAMTQQMVWRAARG